MKFTLKNKIKDNNSEKEANTKQIDDGILETKVRYIYSYEIVACTRGELETNQGYINQQVEMKDYTHN